MQVKEGLRASEGPRNVIFDAQRTRIEPPAAQVLVVAAQTMIAVVGGLDGERRGQCPHRPTAHAGPPRSAKAAPHLRGILPVDDEGMVGSSAALAQPLGIGTVL